MSDDILKELLASVDDTSEENTSKSAEKGDEVAGPSGEGDETAEQDFVGDDNDDDDIDIVMIDDLDELDFE